MNRVLRSIGFDQGTKPVEVRALGDTDGLWGQDRKADEDIDAQQSAVRSGERASAVALVKRCVVIERG
jgi:hypothetical protein